MPKVPIKWRDLLFLIIGGLVATVLNNWTYFSFSREISVADLFTAVLGGYLGLYIASKLTSEVSSERIEKDLLIKDLPNVKSSLSRLYSQLESGNVVFSDSVTIFKECSQTLDELKDMIAICKPKIADEIALNNLLTRLRSLYRTITSYPTIGGTQFDIPAADLFNLKDTTKDINQEITTIIFKINRY